MSIFNRTKLKLAMFIYWNLSWLLSPPLVTAKLIISEIMPRPEASQPEMIEIYNPDNATISLSGFYLTDLLASPSTIYSFDQTDQVTAGQVIVITLSQAKLNNDADGVVLKDDRGQIIDQLSYVDAPIGQSLSLTQLDPPSFSWAEPSFGQVNLTQTSSTPTATPTPTSSVTPSHTPTPTPIFTATPTPVIKLKLTEVFACPQDNQPEWVEVFNPSNTPVTTSLVLIDQADNHIYFLDQPLPALGYQQLNLPYNLLNNSGDTLKLTTQVVNQLLDQVNLPACHPNKSYALIDGVWQETDQPSPGKANPLLTNTPTVTPTLSPTPTTTQTTAKNDQPGQKHRSDQINIANNKSNQPQAGLDYSLTKPTNTKTKNLNLLIAPKLDLPTTATDEAGTVLGEKTQDQSPSKKKGALKSNTQITLYWLGVIMAGAITGLVGLASYVK